MKTFKTIVIEQWANEIVYVYDVRTNEERTYNMMTMNQVISLFNQAGFFVSAIQDFDTENSVVIMTKEIING